MTTILAAVLLSSPAIQAVRVKLDDKEILFDVPPIMRSKVTMVPVRPLINAMNGTLRWEMEKGTVTIWRDPNRVDFHVGSRHANVNGKVATMDEAAFVEKGRVFVPLKFIALSSGYVISEEKGWIILREKKY